MKRRKLVVWIEEESADSSVSERETDGCVRSNKGEAKGGRAMSHDEIAAELGLTRRRVQQIEDGALRKLRKNMLAYAVVKLLLEGRS